MSNAGSNLIPREGEDVPLPAEPSRYLLSTKFYIPPIRSNQIARPRLTDLLSEGLDKTLILVSAPAGYGKTTLVSSWLKAIKASSAWLSLDEGDNDPIRFLQYLLTALLPIAPDIQDELLGMLQGIQPNQGEDLITILANKLASISNPFVLILDDFHVIDSDAVLGILSFFLEHSPPQMHLAVLTRTDPPFPLSRLRVRNQLLNIRADQLRFTDAEIATFLKDVMGLTLSAADLSALGTRTEGWIAGLQLAALSMQNCTDIHGFVSDFSGSHHYVMDYLVEEVLRQQPKQVCDFLLQTSILDRLCGSLCAAIIGAETTGPVDEGTMLATLEGMNLFV